MSKEITFSVGDNVHFVTNRGNKGAGKIVDVNEGLRGAWYTIRTTDDTKVKVRAACMKHAKK